MTDPRQFSILDYTYDLPESLIAANPLPGRSDSRLLIYRNGALSEDHYNHIAQYLPAASLVVFNNTRVIEARLIFQKPSGGQIEIFCLQPHQPSQDIGKALAQRGKILWECFIGGASKWKNGQVLEKILRSGAADIELKASYIGKATESFIIEFSWQPADLSFAEILHVAGQVPLPPYIKREVSAADAERYQTVFARFEGSVAAPTAGLHFTPDIFKSFRSRTISTSFVTLHVGAGTFKPVKAERLGDHDMHAEIMYVTKQTLEDIILHIDGVIVAAGTTSLRTLESLYWLGLKYGKKDSANSPTPSSENIQGEMELGQWEIYDQPEISMTVKEALLQLLQWMEDHEVDHIRARTRILIAPGYRPKVVSGLITNFHQPQSTLLLLVAAMIGEGWRKVYSYALEKKFRFLSYGDGCLLWAKTD